MRQKASSYDGRLQERRNSCTEVSKVAMEEAMNQQTILAYFQHSTAPGALIQHSADRVYRAGSRATSRTDRSMPSSVEGEFRSDAMRRGRRSQAVDGFSGAGVRIHGGCGKPDDATMRKLAR